MYWWQKLVLSVYALANLVIFFWGAYQCKYRKNSYRLVPWLAVFGVFAWGDAVVFGPFWLAVTAVSYLLADWNLFLLIVSVYWVVRSLGETIYWFNQQFTCLKKNPAEKLPLYSFFHNDSIWYIYQICWQCVTVISLVLSVYLAKVWLAAKF